MATPVESQPRDRLSAQKQRTRQAIVDAAAELVAEGVVPTVIQAAERARVGQATAYRYFNSQAALIAEVALPVGDLRHAFDEASDLGPAAQIAAMVRASAEWCYDNPAVLREILRASLAVENNDPGQQRPMRRRGWIEEALASVRDELHPRTYQRISTALTLYFGIDPIVVMQSIVDLPREDAIDALAWSAATLVTAAMNEPADE